MKIATISDVHIKTAGDEAEELLLRFLNHPLVVAADYVGLLGDIFDLMCGPHPIYLKQFHKVFTAIDGLQSRGVKVIFIEGNHEVHLKKLFEQKWKNNEILLTQNGLELKKDEVSYYLSHGDDHEVDNLSYQRYKKFIFSPPMRFVANYLLPYKLLEYIGRKASQKSRKKGSKKFDAEKVRLRFRSGVSINNPPVNFILGGHSHVRDEFTLESGAIYLNNGYALKERVFIYLDGRDYQFISL